MSNNEFVLNDVVAKGLVDDINFLSSQEHNQIFKFIENDGTKYMENENGIFIKINQLKMETIKTIIDYVKDFKKAKIDEEKNNLALFEKKYEEKKTEKKVQENNVTITTKNEVKSTNKKEFSIEEWKKDVILKMRNEVKNKIKKNGKSSKK